MNPFDFQLRTRVVFGPGRLDALGEVARELGGTRALVVTDAGIVAAGHAGRGVAALRRAGLATAVFDAVHENPTTDDVDAAVACARSFAPDLLVGLGGGSAMDCAKGLNFLYTNGGRMQDYWGRDKATRPMLPMIGVPTTAGTGSEAQSFALISDAATHTKMACGDAKAACRVALLDPRLTLTQPPGVTALTGVDALTHAVETYVTRARSPLSMALSAEAFRLLAGNFRRVLRAPDDLEARSAMQLGACLAGMAIENSMLGAAHALANPLTAAYGVIHGSAVGLMLPHVIRFNRAVCEADYRRLLETSRGTEGLPEPDAGAEGLADFLESLLAEAGLPLTAADLGVCRQRLPELAADAARQWTGTFNPREVTAEHLLALYEQAF